MDVAREVKVEDNPAKHRFEAHLDGKLAGHADYSLSAEQITFTHTVVDDAFEGRGVGGALAEGALGSARDRKLRVVPRCSFISDYIEKHEEYADLVDRGA